MNSKSISIARTSSDAPDLDPNPVKTPWFLNLLASHAVLVAQIIFISSLHYLTPVAMHAYHFHAVYQRLYYLPILLASWRYGFGWGLAYALFCGLGYAPHIAFQWPSESFESFTQYLEIGMFFGVSGITGWLFDLGKKRQSLLLEQGNRLRKADRLALMGSLAAGLAHEVRNPLQSLMGAADILKRDLGPQHKDHEFAEILERELQRVNRILNEFLDFARPKPPERLPMDLEEILRGALSVVEGPFQLVGIEIHRTWDPNLPKVWVDAGKIQQVFLNLLLNARDVMPAGGKVQITAFHNDDWVGIRFQDQGSGIASDHIDHLFEPFYTTKPKGTGLGLALSRSILEAHGGALFLLKDISSLDPAYSGACFEIRIPLSPENLSMPKGGN